MTSHIRRTGRWAATAAFLFLLTQCPGLARTPSESDFEPFPAEPYPGHPGAAARPTGDPEKDAELECPVWGHPELVQYPDSVEHFRTQGIKYKPAFNLFNKYSLKRFVLAKDLPGVRKEQVEQFAEPVYYVPMYGLARITDQRRPPVPVVRMTVGSNPLVFDIGRMEPSLYVVRVIAAIETKDARPNPKPLVMQCRINDGNDGAVSAHIRRCRAVDSFYSVAEWYFYAWDDRSFRADISLVERTDVELLVHSVDVHDMLADLPCRAAKRAAVIYPPRERVVESNENAAEPRSREERLARDEIVWNAIPPINTQHNFSYGTMHEGDGGMLKPEHGSWQSTDRRWQRGWDTRFEMKNETLGLAYTLDDLIAHRPLPDPYPIKDRGWGIYFPGPGEEHPTYAAPIADAVRHKMWSYLYNLVPLNGPPAPGRLPLAYYETNDTESAHDAAAMLARIAYHYPTLQLYHGIQNVVAEPKQCWGREPHHRRRRVLSDFARAPALARAYDMLFPYIKDNQLLADSIGRFVPWVRSPEDVRELIETNVLQFATKKVHYYWLGNSHGTSEILMTLVLVQDSPEITRESLEWLFNRCWDYPLPLSGIQDYLNTAVQRDGTTSIGSFFYTQGGSNLSQTAEMIRTYVARGGDSKYDLTDIRRYPKLVTSCDFPIEARVAGLYPLGIGDVGGPLVDYGHWFTSIEEPMRRGWRWAQAPRFAWPLYYWFGRNGESDRDWAQIEKQATETSNPWFANRSRVLSDWAGILESGTHHADWRLRKAVAMRVGYGTGHSHNDSLDLGIWMHGVNHAPDGGQRGGYSTPEDHCTFVHNTVAIDSNGYRGGAWQGHAWIRTLADAPGARFLLGESTPPINHPDVTLFRRHAALIDVADGRSSEPEPDIPEEMIPSHVLTKGIDPGKSYIFDVFRVAGGRRHMYCFHGCMDDDFAWNAGEVREIGWWKQEPGGDRSIEAMQIRKCRTKIHRHAGVAPEVLQATWGLRRKEETLQLYDYQEEPDGTVSVVPGKTASLPNAEAANLRKNYDEAAPRKYTRIHVLGNEGASAYIGDYASFQAKNNFTLLFVENRSEAPDLQSVYPAIIEPYQDKPFVISTRLLPVVDNEDDSLRAVAVEVKTADGPTDVCFADGQPEKVRRVGDMKLSGEFAFHRADSDGLCQATLVGGSVLSSRHVRMALANSAYEATVTKVDYYDRKIWVDQRLPSSLLGRCFVEIGNPRHWTSLQIVDVQDSGGGSVLTFRKSVEKLTSRVLAVDVVERTVKTRLGMPCNVSGKMPGEDDALVASNEDLSRLWRADFVTGSNARGYTWRLYDNKVRQQDLPLGSSFRLFEFGVGDSVRIQAFASLRRLQESTYELLANAPLNLGLEGAHIEISMDGKRWQRPKKKMEDGTLPLGQASLGRGKVYLRARRNEH